MPAVTWNPDRLRLSIEHTGRGRRSLELTDGLLITVKEYTNVTRIQEKARATISGLEK